MSGVEAVLARIAELQTALAPRQKATGNFATALQQATSGGTATLNAPVAGAQPLTPVGMPGVQGVPGAAPVAGNGVGARMVQIAQAEVGQAEQPPGSNDSPRIAEYRTATAGSGVGPWCNYFVSWVAKQAGAPLGEAQQGFGLVDACFAWAQRTGRSYQLGAGRTPQPGDLIVWDEHIGMVERVLPDGKIQTIEGNSSNQVSRRVHGPDGDAAVGFIKMS